MYKKIVQSIELLLDRTVTARVAARHNFSKKFQQTVGFEIVTIAHAATTGHTTERKGDGREGDTVSPPLLDDRVFHLVEETLAATPAGP